MSFVRALYRLTPVLWECSYSRTPLILVSASYSVKTQHRRPIKVYNSDGSAEIENTTTDKWTKRNSTNDRIKGVIELDKDNVHSPSNLENRYSTEAEDSLEDEDENTKLYGTSYVRLGDSDTTFEQLVMKTQSRHQRQKSKIFMLEGKRLIQEAITAGVIPTSIFFTQKSLVENLEMPPGVINLYKFPYNKMKKWSSLQTPPGIVAFCQIPKILKPANKSKSDALPLTLICDNVREPGNLGTILRTFSGVGCLEIILTKGCTDEWDSKVLRGASGAQFHVPIKSGLTWEEINEQVNDQARVFIAHHNGNMSETYQEQTIPTVPYYSVDYSSLSNIVIVVGGETEGISSDAIQFARYRDGLKINVPLSNNIDSLNVGAAVSAILFEIKRQFIMNNLITSNCETNCSDVNVAVSQ